MCFVISTSTHCIHQCHIFFLFDDLHSAMLCLAKCNLAQMHVIPGSSAHYISLGLCYIGLS